MQADWRWTHGYVENVAAAIARVLVDSRTAGEIYNLGEAETPTEEVRIRALEEAVGWGGEVITLPEDELPDHLQAPFDWTYNLETVTSRIREELGFADPIDPTDALRQTADWERPHLSEVAAQEPFNYAAEDQAVQERE